MAKFRVSKLVLHCDEELFWFIEDGLNSPDFLRDPFSDDTSQIINESRNYIFVPGFVTECDLGLLLITDPRSELYVELHLLSRLNFH